MVGESPWSAVRHYAGISDNEMKVRAVRELIRNDGWFQVRQRGSHRQYKHPTKPGTVTVSGSPNMDIRPGTLASVLRQAGLK